MRKIMICLVGAMTAISLAACTPTKIEPTESTRPANAEMQVQSTGGAFDKVPDPNAPNLALVFVYSGNEDATGLVQDLEDVEVLDAPSLVNLLIEKGVLEEGTEVISFDTKGAEKIGPGVEVSETEDGERTGTLNLSKVPNLDAAQERIMLTALGNTFIENFELDRLKLLVNGENYSGTSVKQGDNDYLTYVEKYEKLQ